jgi:carboxylesterase
MVFGRSILIAVGALVGTLSACRPIDYEDDWMDSPQTVDPSIDDADARVSRRLPSPTPEQLATPVIVAAHGFSASSYEWVEFRDYVEGGGDGERGALVSLAVLAGHGRNTEAWSSTTWAQWSAPTLEEYRALRALGYERVYLALASTSGALFVSDLLAGAFDDVAPPDGVYLVAPLVLLGEKAIYGIDLFGWAAGSFENEVNDEERRLFYMNVPAHLLAELRDAAVGAETALNEGVTLPEQTRVRIVGGERDTVVDPAGFDLVAGGLEGDVELELLDTETHVHTRAVARADFDDADLALQRETFEDILAFVGASP